MIDFLKEFLFTLPEKIGYSSQIMVLGIAIVFTGLCILIGCIFALSALLSIKKKEKKAAPKQEAAVVVPEPVAEKAAAQTGASADELIAVITAALMAYTADEKTGSASGKKLVVRNIRAASAKSAAWARAGRADQISSRF